MLADQPLALLSVTLACMCELVRIPRGVVLCKEGDTVDAMYTLLRGSMSSTPRSGARWMLQLGEHSGEHALLGSGAWRSTLVAESECICLMLSAERFGRLMEVLPHSHRLEFQSHIRAAGLPRAK